MSSLEEFSKGIKNGNITLAAHPHLLACPHVPRYEASVLPILMKPMRGSDHTLICLRWHRGFCDAQTSVLSGQRKARPALLLFSPWGFVTQNKQKVCFLGLQKSSRHLVLYRGQIINHSALSLILYFPTSLATVCIHCALSLWSLARCWSRHDTNSLQMTVLNNYLSPTTFHVCLKTDFFWNKFLLNCC